MVLLIKLRKILTDLCLSEISSISVNNKQELILLFLLKILQMTPALKMKETKRILKEMTEMMVKMPMRVMMEKMMKKNISTQNGTKFLQIRFGNPSEINT